MKLAGGTLLPQQREGIPFARKIRTYIDHFGHKSLKVMTRGLESVNKEAKETEGQK